MAMAAHAAAGMLAEHCRSLWIGAVKGESKFSDITVVLLEKSEESRDPIEGKVLDLHLNLLSGSGFFAGMARFEKGETRSKRVELLIDFPQFGIECAMTVLGSLYGVLPPFQTGDPSLVGLLYACSYFDVQHLALSISQFLCEGGIRRSNIVDVAWYAEQEGSSVPWAAALKEAVISFLCCFSCEEGDDKGPSDQRFSHLLALCPVSVIVSVLHSPSLFVWTEIARYDQARDVWRDWKALNQYHETLSFSVDVENALGDWVDLIVVDSSKTGADVGEKRIWVEGDDDDTSDDLSEASFADQFGVSVNSSQGRPSVLFGQLFRSFRYVGMSAAERKQVYADGVLPPAFSESVELFVKRMVAALDPERALAPTFSIPSDPYPVDSAFSFPFEVDYEVFSDEVRPGRSKLRLESASHFYAGSLWSLEVQRQHLRLDRSISQESWLFAYLRRKMLVHRGRYPYRDPRPDLWIDYCSFSLVGPREMHCRGFRRQHFLDNCRRGANLVMWESDALSQFAVKDKLRLVVSFSMCFDSVFFNRTADH